MPALAPKPEDPAIPYRKAILARSKAAEVVGASPVKDRMSSRAFFDQVRLSRLNECRRATKGVRVSDLRVRSSVGFDSSSSDHV